MSLQILNEHIASNQVLKRAQEGDVLRMSCSLKIPLRLPREDRQQGNQDQQTLQLDLLLEEISNN